MKPVRLLAAGIVAALIVIGFAAGSVVTVGSAVAGSSWSKHAQHLSGKKLNTPVFRPDGKKL